MPSRLAQQTGIPRSASSHARTRAPCADTKFQGGEFNGRRARSPMINKLARAALHEHLLLFFPARPPVCVPPSLLAGVIQLFGGPRGFMGVLRCCLVLSRARARAWFIGYFTGFKLFADKKRSGRGVGPIELAVMGWLPTRAIARCLQIFFSCLHMVNLDLLTFFHFTSTGQSLVLGADSFSCQTLDVDTNLVNWIVRDLAYCAGLKYII